MNRLRKLGEFGQSVWLDYIRRSLITSGDLERMIGRDGLCGMTSNPAIFERAIGRGEEYREILASVSGRASGAESIYEQIAFEDVGLATQAMMPVYSRTERRDGYVSLEVSPSLAHETEATCREARRLWNEVGAPNLMIKVPGTAAGVPAIEQLVAEGINVNVTLLFAQDAYEKAAEAYVLGLERLAASGGDLSRVASVASFFVSRIDTEVDKLLQQRIEAAGSDAERVELRSLLGKAAIANAKLAYRQAKEIFGGERWNRLAARGAKPQRVLWASTSTKNPDYRDVLYIEELIGPETVTTIPPDTYDAFLDHGEARASLEQDVHDARAVMDRLGEIGISIDEVTSKLLDDGVRLFSEAFDKLLAAIDAACRKEGGN
jgi:transaldolase/glucose-6-phosphate isomerase